MQLFRRGRGEGCFCRKLVVAPASLSSCSQELVGVLQALAGQALPEALEIQWLGHWDNYGSASHRQKTGKVLAGLAGLTGLRQLHLQLQSTAQKGIAGLIVGALSSLQCLEDLEIEMRARYPQLGSWADLTVVGLTTQDLLQAEVVGAWRVPEVEVRGPADGFEAVGLAPLALSVVACSKLPVLQYSQLTRLRLDRVCRLQRFHQGGMGMPSMPCLAELHLGQGVGVEMPEGLDAGRQEVDLLIAACPTLSQVTEREGMLSYEQLKEAERQGDMTDLDALVREGAAGPMTELEAWGAAAASCKALYHASKATLPLPLLTGLWQALQFRRGRGEAGFFRQLVVAPAWLSSCSQALVGVLHALAGQTLPEALEIQWLDHWDPGSLRHVQKPNMVEASLTGLTGLRQLHLQLHNTAQEHIPGLYVGVLSSLPCLEDLEAEMRAPDPYVSVERGPLASLTRLSITHTQSQGHSTVTESDGIAQAVIDPANLPALRLLQLRSWVMLTVLGVKVPEGQEEVVGAWRVPEVELRGPAEHCIANGLAPLALNVEANFDFPKLAYSQLTRLRLDRVCRLQGVGVEMMEGPDAGRQEVDLLIASCPTHTRVTGREDMLSYEQLKEAGGLGDMTELDAVLAAKYSVLIDPGAILALEALFQNPAGLAAIFYMQ
ncbi:hypothetical protein N2152v2_010881 [Parachlorella kessleri]